MLVPKSFSQKRKIYFTEFFKDQT